MRLRNCFSALLLWVGGSSISGQILNDGTTTNNLVKISSEGLGGDAVAHIQVENGTLKAFQTGLVFQFPFVPLKSVWFANNAQISGATYTVTAEFLPETTATFNRGGVMGWLNPVSKQGIALEVAPGETAPFRVSMVDLSTSGSTNIGTVTNLYNLNGTPATETLGSAWAAGGTYTPTNVATFQLQFSPPGTNDLNVLSNATARITATVMQGTNVVGGAISLLTDLPLPTEHRAGYFGYWAPEFTEGRIGNFDNLTLTAPTIIQPKLDIGLTNGNVVISWPFEFSTWQLQSVTNITNAAAWTTLSTTGTQATFSPTNEMKFFRLARP